MYSNSVLNSGLINGPNTGPNTDSNPALLPCHCPRFLKSDKRTSEKIQPSEKFLKRIQPIRAQIRWMLQHTMLFRRSFSSVATRYKSLDPAKVSFVPTCPSPQYDTGCTFCEADIPSDKPIDYEKPLRSSKVALWRHLLIVEHTHPDSWSSRIELQPGTLLLSILKLKRKLVSPYHPTLVSNIHLSDQPDSSPDSVKLLLYPENKMITVDSKLKDDDAAVTKLINTFLVPQEEMDPDTSLFEVSDHTRRLALVCGHTKRDIRCGLLAPLITKEFSKVLGDRNISDVDVGVVSHVGGHLFAGNVIYFNGQGESIWYGRVTPKNVQGIVEETIVNGRIIEDHYRG